MPLVTVAPSGADFTTIQGAIDSITTASSANPFVVQVFPGIYDEQITCKDYVHLLGTGQTQYGPASVLVHHTEWVIITAQCNISNIRFGLDTGGSNPTQMIVDGQFTSSSGRTIFFNCYFVVDGSYGAANVSLAINSATGSCDFVSCQAYFRPSTSGAVIVFYSVGGSCDLFDFVMNHYLPTNYSSCIFWQKKFATQPDEINGLYFSREQPTSAGFGGTSSTSLTIGTGSKAFTTAAGLGYTNGARVRASSAVNPANFMEGLVTSYVGTTLTINIDTTGGSGTLSDWRFNLGTPIVFRNDSASNLYINGVSGLKFVTVGTVVAGAGTILGATSASNQGMPGQNTVNNGDLGCATGVMTTPALGSIFAVFVNGSRVNVGDGVKTTDCYFSSDSGTTAKRIANIIAGDLMYWNGAIAGFQLSTSSRITFDYCIG